MHILMISHEYPPIGGGGANACMHLAREYVQQGHKVTIITVGWGQFEQKESLFDGELNIHRLECNRSRVENCSFAEMLDFVLKGMRYACSLAKVEDFDVTQVFFGIPSGPIGYILKKRYGIPYIIRFGGGDIPGFQNRFKFIYKLIEIPLKVIWKNASALVANSEGLKDFAYSFCDKYPIDVIYNGVDTDFFHPAEVNGTDSIEENCDDTIRLLFVSRLIERKGLQYLIPYLQRIMDETGKRIKLIIVGDGPYRKELERLADEYNVSHLVSFEGQKDKSELPDYYQMGDVFVFPSIREGMPNVVLEAMASGLPIIMMKDCEGARELVEENGFLVGENYHIEIIKFIKLSQNEIMKMSICSRSRAVGLFGWNMAAKQYIKLFEVERG